MCDHEFFLLSPTSVNGGRGPDSRREPRSPTELIFISNKEDGDWYSENYSRVLKQLLGKPISELDEDSLLLYEEMLYDLNMNYYDLSDINNLHSSIGYYDKENEYYHPFSLKEVGKSFGYNKLSEIMTLKDYLEGNPSLMDPVIEGIIEGQKLRYDRDEQHKSKAMKAMENMDTEAIEALLKKG